MIQTEFINAEHYKQKKMEQLVEHVAGGYEESKAGVVAKYLDQQDPKFVEVVMVICVRCD